MWTSEALDMAPNIHITKYTGIRIGSVSDSEIVDAEVQV